MRDAQDDDSFSHVMRRRRRRWRVRCAQVALIAALAWLATGGLLAIAWLAVTTVFGFLEVLACRLGRSPRNDRIVAAAQGMAALTFAGMGVVLLRDPGPLRLAEALLLLCATTLGNAMQASGSPLARLTLVGPPASLLVASPFWVALASPHLPLADAALIAAASLAFIGFSLRLATSMHSEREALRRAHREAEAGNQRWRMIFNNSPMARVCFDASRMYDALQARAPGSVRLGDVARDVYPSVEAMLAHVTLIEANQVALAQIGPRIDQNHFAPGYLDAFAEALNHIDDDGVIPPFEAGVLLASGETMWVQAHFRMTGGPGAPWSLCTGAYADMTEAHRTALAQEEARRAAEEANRAKSDFLAVMSHEIRTPLNGVLGMAQAMDLEPLAPQQRERLRVIRESGSALLDLLDDLLDISRIEAGRLALDVQDFDLAAVVESAHAAFAAEAANKRLSFPLEIDPAVKGLWRGDSARVRQVVGNLVSNGVKFTHAGEVAVRLSRSASGVRVEVSDTGIGIARDRTLRLFDKFVQADASATRAYGGTGLGLAICQELCQAMGGAITVDSAPGAGSTFAIELPLRQVERAIPELDPMALAGGFAMRVLAAEGNPVNRLVLKALLAQFDIDPTIVENGAEAVRAWEAAHWDLILMDVQMPQMDGPTAAMTIRAREAVLGRPRTPILAVTANTMAHQVASYRAAGMDDVVSKPLNIGDLFAAMIAAVGRAEEDEDLRAAG
jgi:signal transduction histidine kinase/AmiR/NasT family two-component response regulator